MRILPCRRTLLALAVSLAWIAGCSGPSSLQMAEAAYQSGEYDSAIAWSTKAIDKDSGAADAYLIRGKCYEKKGQPMRAVADFEVARVEMPDRGEPAFRQAKCYLAAGRPVDAETTINKALKDRYKGYSLRDQMLAHAVQGEVQMAVGDYPRASESFGTALNVARTSRPLEAEGATGILHYNLSRAQFEQGSYRKSRESFQSYLLAQKRTGDRPREQDLYTLTVLHFLCEDISASRNLAATLSPEYKARAEEILSGETFSVGALYDLKLKQKQSESATDSNP